MLLLRVLCSLIGAAAYDRIAGYSPSSLVTDYNAIDVDLYYINYYLEPDDYGNPNEFKASDYSIIYSIYTQGGNSKSTARMALPSSVGVEYGDAVVGTAMDGSAASGVVSSVSGSTVYVKYDVPTAQTAAHANCRVGGLPAAHHIITGCFDATSPISIGGTAVSVSAITNEHAGRTLQGFSVEASKRLRTCSIGCPYWLYMQCTRPQSSEPPVSSNTAPRCTHVSVL